MSIKGKCCTCGTQRPGHDAPIVMRKCMKCNDGRLKDEEKLCPLCGEEQQEDVLSDFHINKAEALGLTEQLQAVIGRYGRSRVDGGKFKMTPDKVARTAWLLEDCDGKRLEFLGKAPRKFQWSNQAEGVLREKVLGGYPDGSRIMLSTDRPAMLTKV